VRHQADDERADGERVEGGVMRTATAFASFCLMAVFMTCSRFAAGNAFHDVRSLAILLQCIAGGASFVVIHMQ
jgi:hypothetical protein